jgi:hypothetical protein
MSGYCFETDQNLHALVQRTAYQQLAHGAETHRTIQSSRSSLPIEGRGAWQARCLGRNRQLGDVLDVRDTVTCYSGGVEESQRFELWEAAAKGGDVRNEAEANLPRWQPQAELSKIRPITTYRVGNYAALQPLSSYPVPFPLNQKLVKISHLEHIIS